ncbi:Methylmalonyl-CoA mutase [Reichenbachiella faecimaris]|uniref:Methylmalonyl-CoA mutase n=1 Tax=Reichenbachiella faecimaris TaxID=692418 RepID=A0A1W2GNI9_REIFA|nr:methylmalonyl-CoA mutase family protein [Reichenbachiella faecimaris]SMD37826.1 Methylmalonyl-CoA mutase [Reichenbachiella faecimaris]
MIKAYNFDEFATSSKAQWLDKLKKDLGDDAAQRILTWQCERELNLSSYYDEDDLVRSYSVPQSRPDWKYLQPLGSSSSNTQAMDGLMNGADGLILSDAPMDSLDKLLEKVAPQYCTIGLRTSNFSEYLKFVEWWKEKHPSGGNGEVLLFHATDELVGRFDTDLISFISQSFELGHGLGHKTLHVDGGWVQKNGGSASLELAFMLSQTVHYINNFLDAGHKLEEIAQSIFVSTSVGSSYFLELVKVRGMRLLLNQLFKQYGLRNVSISIHVETSPITKSALDANTNFLRCTSEAMSAILGGADYLSIAPHHSLPSADRIARNISNLLKEESYFNKISDPAAGSYYMESLSGELMKDAWSTFQQVEAEGGFEVAVKNKIFKKKIKDDFAFQAERITSGLQKMVGVNDFGNQDEKIFPDQLTHAHLSLADNFEVVRKDVESYVKDHGEASRPTAYLLGIGSNAKMINARYTFVTNFFNWAGVKVEKVNSGQNLNQQHIIVCCGADEDYTEANIQKALNGQVTSALMLAAGKKSVETSNQITGWVNTKSNRLVIVKNMLSHLGITQNPSLS